jgi:4-hydroxybenzoate polyprenyltransferase
LLASGAYLINDVVDAAQDRLHPEKARRPIAQGEIAPLHAIVVGIVLLGVGLAAAAALSREFLVLCLGYLALTLLYTLWLKRFAVVDVFAIAIGFVLRAAAGAVVINVYLSPWLLLCTLLGALLIALAKRRHELTLLEGKAVGHRASLGALTVELLDEWILITAACSIMAYSLYTIFERPGQMPLLMLTIPFVIYGVFRYLYLVRIGGLGGSPETVLLSERPLLGTVVLWAALSTVLLYLTPR